MSPLAMMYVFMIFCLAATIAGLLYIAGYELGWRWQMRQLRFRARMLNVRWPRP
jgi:hypothetical protein